MSGDSNSFLVKSKTHGERLWFNYSTRTQTSEQEYNDIPANNRRPSTPYSRNIPKAFHEEPGCMLSRQIMRRYFCHTISISQNLDCSATSGTKTSSGVLHLWFNYLGASFFKAFGIYCAREAKERDASEVSAFTLVSLLHEDTLS